MFLNWTSHCEKLSRTFFNLNIMKRLFQWNILVTIRRTSPALQLQWYCSDSYSQSLNNTQHTTQSMVLLPQIIHILSYNNYNPEHCFISPPNPFDTESCSAQSRPTIIGNISEINVAAAAQGSAPSSIISATIIDHILKMFLWVHATARLSSLSSSLGSLNCWQKWSHHQ